MFKMVICILFKRISNHFAFAKGNSGRNCLNSKVLATWELLLRSKVDKECTLSCKHGQAFTDMEVSSRLIPCQLGIRGIIYEKARHHAAAQNNSSDLADCCHPIYRVRP